MYNVKVLLVPRLAVPLLHNGLHTRRRLDGPVDSLRYISRASGAVLHRGDDSRNRERARDGLHPPRHQGLLTATTLIVHYCSLACLLSSFFIHFSLFHIIANLFTFLTSFLPCFRFILFSNYIFTSRCLLDFFLIFFCII